MSTYDVPNPDGLSWETWVSGFINNNPRIVNVAPAGGEDAWRTWAQELQLQLPVDARNAPEPLQDTWQDWTRQLAAALEGTL